MTVIIPEMSWDFWGMGMSGSSSLRASLTGKKTFSFQYLLERVLGYPNLVDWMTDANQDNALFHLLVFLFPRYLKAAMRKGDLQNVCAESLQR